MSKGLLYADGSVLRDGAMDVLPAAECLAPGVAILRAESLPDARLLLPARRNRHDDDGGGVHGLVGRSRCAL
jgi:hypothetical protein